MADPRIPLIQSGPYIRRWFLEKRDPGAAVSEVVAPIVFRLAEDVPARWVPCIRAAIEQWNPVFESLGYRHALVVRQTADTLSTGTAHTAREITVHWRVADDEMLAGDTEVTDDSRTGEALSGTITLNGGILWRASRNTLLYGELDPHTSLPLADSLQQLLLRYVVEHEVGHALGLAHNFKGAAVYPTDSLRRASFVRRWGSVASVMAYSDGNYVAQPEDKIPLADRVPRIGPYDRWAIAWAYRPIPEAATPEAEQPVLEAWRQAQDTALYLQAALDGGIGSDRDPANKAGTMGDDLLKSAEYGIQNLARYAAAIDVSHDTVATHPQPADIANKWHDLIELVEGLIGGVRPKPPFRPGDQVPVDSAAQVEALRFVLGHLFSGEDAVVRDHVLPSARLPLGVPAVVWFDVVAPGWDEVQWQGFQAALVNRLPERLQVLKAEPGIHRALCQELAAFRARLEAATAAPSATPLKDQAVTALALLFDANRDGKCA